MAAVQEGPKKQGKQWDPIPNPRKTLARKIRESPRDPKPRLVFADHLLMENDPRGQLIISKLQSRKSNNEEIEQLQMIERQARNKVMNEFPGVRVIGWDCGFPSCAYFQNQNDFARLLESGNGDLLPDEGIIQCFMPDSSFASLIREFQIDTGKVRDPLEVLVPYRGLYFNFNPRSNLNLSSGITMERALEIVREQDKIMASNSRLDLVLSEDYEIDDLERGFWCWSGTMTAYEKPGMPFGDFVEDINPVTHFRYLFIVPKEYRGKSDCILVADHPDFDLEVAGNDRIIHAKKVDVIEKFPPSRGWYYTDQKYGIPFGELIASSGDEEYWMHPHPYARFLNRCRKRVGLIARGFANLEDGTMSGFSAPLIGLNLSQNQKLGLIVKASLRGDEG